MLKGSKTMAQENRLKLSGDRFAVVYHLSGSEAEASAKAADICLEQTVELPDELVKDRSIREEIVGQVVSLRQLQPDLFEAVITFAAETSGFELTQLLNVIFGNISLQPGIRVERLQLWLSLPIGSPLAVLTSSRTTTVWPTSPFARLRNEWNVALRRWREQTGPPGSIAST